MAGKNNLVLNFYAALNEVCLFFRLKLNGRCRNISKFEILINNIEIRKKIKIDKIRIMKKFLKKLKKSKEWKK